DQTGASHSVVLIVEPTDVMGETLGCIGSQVEHIVESVLVEDTGHQFEIIDRPLDEVRIVGNVVGESPAQIIDYHDVVARSQERGCHVRTEKPGSAGHQTFTHPSDVSLTLVCHFLDSFQETANSNSSPTSVANRWSKPVAITVGFEMPTISKVRTPSLT